MESIFSVLVLVQANKVIHATLKAANFQMLHNNTRMISKECGLRFTLQKPDILYLFGDPSKIQFLHLQGR